MVRNPDSVLTLHNQVEVHMELVLWFNLVSKTQLQSLGVGNGNSECSQNTCTYILELHGRTTDLLLIIIL